MSGTTLDDLLEQVWRGLIRGAHTARHGFHLPVVATVDSTGRPRGRVVVLRRVDRAQRALLFHTDARAAKLDQLGLGVTWVFYDAKSRLQARIHGVASLADDEVTDAQWEESRLSARKCYLVSPAPGTPVAGPTSGHHGRLDGEAVPSMEESRAGRSHFAVVTTSIEEIEVLQIRRAGHLRARFVWQEAWSGTWLVP